MFEVSRQTGDVRGICSAFTSVPSFIHDTAVCAALGSTERPTKAMPVHPREHTSFLKELNHWSSVLWSQIFSTNGMAETRYAIMACTAFGIWLFCRNKVWEFKTYVDCLLDLSLGKDFWSSPALSGTYLKTSKKEPWKLFGHWTWCCFHPPSVSPVVQMGVLPDLFLGLFAALNVPYKERLSCCHHRLRPNWCQQMKTQVQKHENENANGWCVGK